MENPEAHEPKRLKACDACKSRKVDLVHAHAARSGKSPAITATNGTLGDAMPSVNVQLLPDHAPPTPSAKEPNRAPTPSPPLPSLLYIDRLLASPHGVESVNEDKQFGFRGTGLFGGNYNLSFFSDSRLASLSARLGNTKVKDLVKRISSIINGRVKPADTVLTGPLSRRKGNFLAFEDREQAAKWINRNVPAPHIYEISSQMLTSCEVYYEKVHSVFPFLNRQSFEAAASSRELPTLLKRDKAWSALYHTVLALGCQHDGGGSYEPGTGRAWSLFSTSLALFPDLVTLPNSLNLLQATAAMAIYASSISCISIEHAIVSEGARRAQSLGYTTLSGEAQEGYQRTFWCLYTMEKVASFYFGRTSVFVDHDIACPFPLISETRLGDVDWSLSFVRHARLLSKALSSVFSVGVRGSSGLYYNATLEKLLDELEQWRLSIPLEARPGGTFRKEVLHQPLLQQVILWTHFLYHSSRLVFLRAFLQLTLSFPDIISPGRQSQLKTDIMVTSWAILELTTFIEVEPQTPLWVIAGVPVIALFVLFDLVVHSPRHPETDNNLALLDMAGGHFSRLQYASGGTLPGSLLTEFAYIAREYVNNVRLRGNEQVANDGTSLSDGAVWTAKGVGGQIGSSVPPADHGPEEGPSDPGPMQMGAMPLSAADDLYDLDADVFAGTDVMNLFNYFIPGIDPVFWPGTVSAEMYYPTQDPSPTDSSAAPQT
ncbi:uncharacterized protein E0L32_007450 [Thyridium curvatum]|uniref:Xylanolytic transcriptional activator regulatory domain-containing protein n=1 Tax=Thyridium curvatum TaxID=1093900 RepID=A0A507APS2_9PEZI|nr:uncharacterized protein E0L32_007450 [Thyridium curvatum]TPX11952.1 hypothetical protein E0L32_007450 [Thyridium curvatum]